ncbi:MAG: GGDEF domain-containing protein [Campylobacterota bacterium]|nr:GGDEF domain-containing protein [Campylobacterota bacterium]
MGSAFELFLFSLALGYKLKVLQIEKIEAIENLNRELESKIIEHTQALKDSNQKLRRLSVTDQLTNLYNRRGIDTLLEKSYIEFTKENMRFGIILLDIDYFKRINDKYGHDIGDYVLRQIAQTLAKGIEEHHYLGRWGGEEFLIIASHDDLSSLSNLAQKLRANIEALALKGIESVTASFGVAMIDSTKNTAQVVKEADNNLYQAKKEGRNRVVPEI